MNLRSILLKALNGIPQEYHDKQMRKGAQVNSLLQKTLFSYEADNLAKYEEIEQHTKLLKMHADKIALLEIEVKKLNKSLDIAETVMKHSTIKNKNK